MTHIREQIISALVADGWTYKSHSGAFHFERMQETGGQFGRAKQTLVMDAAGDEFRVFDLDGQLSPEFWLAIS